MPGRVRRRQQSARRIARRRGWSRGAARVPPGRRLAAERLLERQHQHRLADAEAGRAAGHDEARNQASASAETAARGGEPRLARRPAAAASARGQAADGEERACRRPAREQAGRAGRRLPSRRARAAPPAHDPGQPTAAASRTSEMPSPSQRPERVRAAAASAPRAPAAARSSTRRAQGAVGMTERPPEHLAADEMEALPGRYFAIWLRP